MLVSLALALTAAAGLFLVGLGLLSFIRPAHVRRFFLGFATTSRKHFLELAIRLVLGAALVLAAPRMPGAQVIQGAGWVLLCSTAVMLFVPWQMHRAFAQRVVPMVLGYLPLLGLASLLGGGALVWSIYAAGAA